MNERAFDFASFCAHIGASPKERSALRRNLVRGLKDYFEAIHGFDRYGGETIFHLSAYLGIPLAFGYAAWRILHDRRIAETTRLKVAELVLEAADYGADAGVPYGLFAALHFLQQHGRLSTEDLRYGLVMSANESEPFAGLDKAELVAFFDRLLGWDGMPSSERLFWAHSLITRHHDRGGTAELISCLMADERQPLEARAELCQAWINQRQPRLLVPGVQPAEGFRAAFVAEHLPFWVTHAPSWPTPKMVHLGLVWLARLRGDALELARTYVVYRGPFQEQAHSAVVDILAEHQTLIPRQDLLALIEQGIALAGESGTRQRFYRLGAELFGVEYLNRASLDSANRVRQWATRQLQR